MVGQASSGRGSHGFVAVDLVELIGVIAASRDGLVRLDVNVGQGHLLPDRANRVPSRRNSYLSGSVSGNSHLSLRRVS